MVFVHQHAPEKTVPGFPLRALLLPRVTGRPATTLNPASKSAALLALAPSTIIQLHTAGRDALERMTALVRQVPCYNLELGTDIAGIAPVLAGSSTSGWSPVSSPLVSVLITVHNGERLPASPQSPSPRTTNSGDVMRRGLRRRTAGWLGSFPDVGTANRQPRLAGPRNAGWDGLG